MQHTQSSQRVPDLISLPLELLNHIAQFLSLDDIFALSLTCRTLRDNLTDIRELLRSLPFSTQGLGSLPNYVHTILVNSPQPQIYHWIAKIIIGQIRSKLPFLLMDVRISESNKPFQRVFDDLYQDLFPYLFTHLKRLDTDPFPREKHKASRIFLLWLIFAALDSEIGNRSSFNIVAAYSEIPHHAPQLSEFLISLQTSIEPFLSSRINRWYHWGTKDTPTLKTLLDFLTRNRDIYSEFIDINWICIMLPRLLKELTILQTRMSAQLLSQETIISQQPSRTDQASQLVPRCVPLSQRRCGCHLIKGGTTCILSGGAATVSLCATGTLPVTALAALGPTLAICGICMCIFGIWNKEQQSPYPDLVYDLSIHDFAEKFKRVLRAT